MHQPIDFARIARLEEGRIARGVAEVADAAIEVAGGIAACAQPGSWMNSAYGCGLTGPGTREDVRRLIDFHSSRGAEPRVEVAPFADKGFVAALADEKFVVRVFDTVFFRPLGSGETIELDQAGKDVVVEVVDPSRESEVDEFTRVATSGFLPAGMSEWPEEMLESMRRVVRHPRVVCVRAMLDGRAVGAGSVEVSGEIAGLFGVSVLAEYRRRGAQQAMMQWRLRYAQERGALFATICSRPGVATERNAQRAGFRVAYTRVAMVRPGEGLAPEMS